MKKFLVIFCVIFLFNLHPKSIIHEIAVWDGYMQFLPSDLGDVQLGDTINWLPLSGPPSMMHTITSVNIPVGAVPFDQIWQAPADTFFQYIPIAVGLYEYVCTPHAAMMVGSFNVVSSQNLAGLYATEEKYISFPNPVKNRLNIIDQLIGLEYIIFKLDGAVSSRGITKSILDISNVNPGLYILIIYADKPKQQTIVVY